MKSQCLAYCVFLGGLLITWPSWSDDQRFQAELMDGTRIVGDELRNWHDTRAQPVLGNHPVFDSANPLRWVIDTALKVSGESEAYIEFLGGDCIPATVIGAGTGAESKFDRVPPFLLIDRQPWTFPGQSSPEPIRIQTRWIRRIVWERRAKDSLEPGALFYRDGRRVLFRALRWAPKSVELLLDQTTVEIAFQDIAELHFPQADPWNSYVEQLAFLSPGGSARLFQWETKQGLRVTGSAERFQAKPHGNQNDPGSWWHMVQPAWSLDPLWVSHRQIRTRRFFEPHIVPLSLLEPVRSTHRAGLAGGWTWSRDRNVQSGPLQSGGQEYGWGVGVQAHHELEYELPSGAQSFRTKIGLDRCVGNGGCARGKIAWKSNPDSPVFQSEVLIGSKQVVDSGLIPTSGQSTIILTADAAVSDRPPGADPFDIRDSLDWLEPEVRVDPVQLAAQIHAATVKLFVPWEGWTVIDANSGPFVFKNRWLTLDSRNPRYIPEISSRVPFLTIARSIKVQPQLSELILVASRFSEGTTPAHLQVRVNGESIGEYDIPVRSALTDPEPIQVSLEAYRGQQVQLEVSQMAGGPQALVDWRAAIMFDRRPGLLKLIEDEDPKLAAGLIQGSGTSTFDVSEAYSGTASLRISGGEAGNPSLFPTPLAIREQPRLGEYRFLRFVWRKKQGQPVCLQVASEGRWGEENTRQERQTYRYDAGTGERSHGGARRMDDRLPADWIVVTRDLVGDWGEFNLTGLSFGSGDMEHAWLDHVYLARTWQDLDKIPKIPHPSREKK